MQFHSPPFCEQKRDKINNQSNSNSTNISNDSSSSSNEYDKPIYLNKCILLPSMDMIIEFISNYFTFQIQQSQLLSKHKKGHFSSKLIPNLTLLQFVTRIVKYTQIEKYSLLAAFYYILKLLKGNDIIITSNNSYNLLLVSCVVSIKFNEDVKYKNNYYTKIGGLKIEKLNYMEYEFCALLNFELFINDVTFELFINDLFSN